MSTNTFLHFYDSPDGPIQLSGASIGMENKEFAIRFPGIRGFRFDSFERLVDKLPGTRYCAENFLPVTRVIRYKKNPSLHVCNAKCMGGKPNGVCECSCGGKNHGVSSL